MMATGMRFTEREAGCWVDGTYGTDHALRKLAEMVEDAGGVPGAALAAEMRHAAVDLEAPAAEFWTEMADDALALLAEATDPGYVWAWDGGDLLLLAEAEAEAA